MKQAFNDLFGPFGFTFYYRLRRHDCGRIRSVWLAFKEAIRPVPF